MSDLNCIYCGSNNVKVEEKNNGKTIVTCKSCGEADVYI